MSDQPKRRNLGRGLSSLMGAEVTTTKIAGTTGDAANAVEQGTAPIASGNQKTLSVSKLVPGRYQPRRAFDESEIDSLAQSIKEKGILQPILVRDHPDQDGFFEIIAGERRWQAAQKAQLHDVPVIIKDLNDQEAAEIALVENLQRQDLSPLEEAEGYRRLMEEFEHTQENLAKVLAKSRSHVANMMRLLGLPDPVKGLLEDGALSAGHARALLNAENPSDLASQVVKKGLNVRQTEALARQQGVQARPKKSGSKAEKDTDTLALERDLTNLLGMAVDISMGKTGGGALTIKYGSLEQLDDVLNRLSHGAHGQAAE